MFFLNIILELLSSILKFNIHIYHKDIIIYTNIY
jgi:hypothetical protein